LEIGEESLADPVYLVRQLGLLLGKSGISVSRTVYTLFIDGERPSQTLELFLVDLSRDPQAILMFSAALHLDEHWLL
jgi:hypothetical protein